MSKDFQDIETINRAFEEAHEDYEKRKMATLYDLTVMSKALYYYNIEGKICKEAYESFYQVINNTMKFIKEREI